MEVVNGNIRLCFDVARIQESPLPVAQGTPHGRHQDRSCGFQESRLKYTACRLLPQSLKTNSFLRRGGKMNYGGRISLPEQSYGGAKRIRAGDGDVTADAICGRGGPRG